ncbi:hypothetical protein [Pseudomonas helleri]|uniref:Uncharacterized protein n=1 Tax=Pseudomonas helleri TaxID=1608996 RepID=A0A6L5HWA4_9PSED|nr:hypothetical protein [Pseudomonas helleri]MQU07686.1 hypothetical protein [Pseudomonas helleri]
MIFGLSSPQKSFITEKKSPPSFSAANTYKLMVFIRHDYLSAAQTNLSQLQAESYKYWPGNFLEKIQPTVYLRTASTALFHSAKRGANPIFN